MREDSLKQALLNAAKELLEETREPEELTSRQIAARAGTNAAMINYYFRSKDELLNEAVGGLLDLTAKIFSAPPDPDASPKERLRDMLGKICGVVLRYRRYTQIYVPHILLEDEISLPNYVLPEIREHFGGKRSEAECRIIAYQMISFLQLAFYRSDAFFRYTGMNLSEEEACRMLIDTELDLLLPEEGSEWI